MERLTARQAIKHADGTSHIVTYCHGHRYGPAAFPDKYGTSNPQEYENYCEMVDRLAAYEDIGTVEELQRLVTLAVALETMPRTENRGMDESGEYDISSMLLCPVCTEVVGDWEAYELYCNYCPECGQKLKLPANDEEAAEALKEGEGK